MNPSIEWVIVWILYIFEDAIFFLKFQLEDKACQSDSDCRRSFGTIFHTSTGIKEKFQNREWSQL